jgi:hypothetical protein
MIVNRIAADFSVVTRMWDFYQITLEDFSKVVEKNKTQLMLAITAPENEQKFAWKALKASGFKKIASGLRSPNHSGHKYLYLWGKRNKIIPELKLTHNGSFNFNSCGADGLSYKKTDKKTQSTLGDCIRVHRVPTGAKTKIPKDFELIAKTYFAKYYAEKAQKIFETL